ncbi:hypothetical protein [Paenibacillus sp. HB172176]|nr:hypothetical protein [Paenibacillus sp. HB172176]
MFNSLRLGEQQIRIFTEDIFPSLTLYFQDDVLTHYTFAMGGGD